MGYSPWGRKESDTTERLHSLTHTVCRAVKSQVDFLMKVCVCARVCVCVCARAEGERQDGQEDMAELERRIYTQSLRNQRVQE